MSDDGEKLTSVPADHDLDQPIAPASGKPEKYNTKTEEGVPIADRITGAGNPEAIKPTSATLAEIERSLANGMFRAPNKKIDQFGQDMDRKTDMRLRSLTRPMASKLHRDHIKEMTTGPETHRVRNFDIQSQTLRQIQANAALGSYQFQKTMVLPYMRKSLAVSYQKASLLKDLVKSIASLQLATVGKLDAIKVNTAAAVPRKKSFLKKMWSDVGMFNRRRIAANVSNYMMDSWDTRYKKVVAPRLARINEVLKDQSQKGGLNGLRRGAVSKLNQIRKATKDMSERDVSKDSPLERIKVASAKGAEKILTGVVRGSQYVRMGEDRNKKLSGVVQQAFDPVSKFNPFSRNATALHDDVTPGQEQMQSLRAGGTPTLFKSWHKEYREDLDKVIGLLGDISQKLSSWRGPPSSGGPRGSGPKGPRKPKGGPSVASRKVSSTELTPVEPETPHVTVREHLSKTMNRVGTVGAHGLKTSSEILKMGTDAIASHVPKVSLPNLSLPKPASEPEPHTVQRPRQSIGSSLRKMRGTMQDRQGKVTASIAKTLGPVTSRLPGLAAKYGIPTMAAAVALPAVAKAHAITGAGHVTSAMPDAAFFATMFGNLSNKMEAVRKSIDGGNRSRSMFERLQTKWKEMSERNALRRSRKNSYEDLEAHRGDKKESDSKEKAGPQLPTGSNLARGNVLGAAGDWMSDLWGMGQDYLMDKATDKLEAGGKRLMSGVRGGGGIKARLGRVFGRGAAEVGEELAEDTIRSGSGRSLMGRAGGMLWSGTKGAARLGTKGAVGSLKLGVKGLAGMAKYGTKGLIGLGKKGIPYLPGLIKGTAKGTWGLGKLALKGGWGATKLGARAGLGLTKFGLRNAPKAIAGSAKLGWGASKFLGKELGGLTKFAAREAGGLAKLGGGALLKGGLKAGGGLAKGLNGPAGLLMIPATMYADHLIDKHTTGITNRLGHTATSMATWATTGATLGSIVPGVGTAIGGAVGAGLGAVLANSDLLSQGLKYSAVTAMSGFSKMSNLAAQGGHMLYSKIMGKPAGSEKPGTEKNAEQTSVLGSVKSYFFGKDATYSKVGSVMAMGTLGVIPMVGKGIYDVFLGKNGIKSGDLLKSIKDGIAGAFSGLKDGVGKLWDGVKSGAQSVVDTVGSTASQAWDKTKDAAQSVGSTMSAGLKGAMSGALSMVGMSETANKGQIEGYLAKGGANNVVDPSLTSWCAAFVNATLAQAGLKGTGKLTASSFLAWGTPVDPKSVQPGDVLVEDRGVMAGQSGAHVGLATGATRTKEGRFQIEMLSGNSGNRVTKIFYDANKLKVRRARDSASAQALKMTVNNNPWEKNLKNNPGASQNPNESVKDLRLQKQDAEKGSDTDKSLWGRFKSGLSGAAGAVGNFASQAWQNTTNAVGSAASAVGNAVGSAVQAVSNVVYKMSGSTKENFKKIMNIAAGFGDPHPEITAAQWALESAWGQKMSGKNNPFGQKARKGEPATMVSTREVYNGQNVRIMAPFKDYNTLEDAIKEHVEKWTKRKTQPGTSPIQAAAQIKAAGYATDPNYVNALGKILASNNIDPNKPFAGASPAGGGKLASIPMGNTQTTPTQNKTGLAAAFNATNGKAPALLSNKPTPAPSSGNVSLLKPGAKPAPTFAPKAAPTKTVTAQANTPKPVVKTLPPAPAKPRTTAATPPTPAAQATASPPVQAQTVVATPVVSRPVTKPAVVTADLPAPKKTKQTESEPTWMTTFVSTVHTLCDALTKVSGDLVSSTKQVAQATEQHVEATKAAATTMAAAVKTPAKDTSKPSHTVIPVSMASATPPPQFMAPMSMAKTDMRTG